MGSEVFTFKEGENWIAAWSRFDVISQAKTEVEAVERLIRSIAWQVICDGEDNNLKSLGSCPPVRDEVKQDYIRKYRISHPNECHFRWPIPSEEDMNE